MLNKIINRFLTRIENHYQLNNASLKSYAKIQMQINGNDKWSEFQKKIKLEFNQNPDGFLREKTISFTLHPNQQLLGARYYSDLIKNKKFSEVYASLLSEDNFGNPYNLRVYPRTSPTLVQHIHHLVMIENFFGRKIFEFDSVTEFGGGYGSLARLLSRLNYSGEHTICDLEFMSKLQEFYLQNLNLKKHKVDWISDINQINMKPSEDHLFIATWSFSETPFTFREQMIKKLLSFENIFLTFQEKFAELDNLKYFEDLACTNDNISIKKCRVYPGNYFFIKRN
ncbi:hypothetical protein N9E40_04455 [Amylibacter sp.]|nr:hypothetical protein [Amylibacter sp.]